MLDAASQHGPSRSVDGDNKLGHHDKSIGQVFDSLPDFQKHAKSLLAQHHSEPAEYIAFPYQAFQSLVCRHWKLLKCPAGVAAEQARPNQDTWILRAMELRHCGRCQPSSHDEKLAEAVSDKLTGLTAQAKQSVEMREASVGPASESDMEISPPTSPSSSSEPLSARFPPLSSTSAKKASLDRVSVKVKTPAQPEPQEHSPVHNIGTFAVQPPQMDQVYSSFEAYYAAVVKFGQAEHPEYGLYFRARKQIRPEAYCKYMNSPSASTTPSLGCKYGFSAKKQPGGDTYKVTKSHPHHLTECRKRTLAENATASATSQRKRKSASANAASDADLSENEEYVVESGKKRKLSSSA